MGQVCKGTSLEQCDVERTQGLKYSSYFTKPSRVGGTFPAIYIPPDVFEERL